MKYTSVLLLLSIALFFNFSYAQSEEPTVPWLWNCTCSSSTELSNYVQTCTEAYNTSFFLAFQQFSQNPTNPNAIQAICTTMEDYFECLRDSPCPCFWEFLRPTVERAAVAWASLGCTWTIVDITPELIARIRASGDPHYIKMDGSLVTCYDLGWQLVARGTHATVWAYHEEISSTYKASKIKHLRVEVSAIGEESSLIISEDNYTTNAVVGSLSYTDQRIKAGKVVDIIVDKGTAGLIWSGSIGDVSDGILKNGCIEESLPVTPSSLAVSTCAGFTGIEKQICEYDVTVMDTADAADSATKLQQANQRWETLNPPTTPPGPSNSAFSAVPALLFSIVLLVIAMF